MICSTKSFFVSILYEQGEPSLTRLIAVLAYLSFLAASFFMIFTGQTWSGYDTFASVTAGGGSIMQILNKFINSKYNSPLEEHPHIRGGIKNETSQPASNQIDG